MSDVKHPIQPIVLDKHGVARFKENAIVRHLLDHGGIDMNALARLDFSDNDWQQFAQLIGYSVSGFGDLSYTPDDIVAEADRIVARMMEEPEKTLEPQKARRYFRITFQWVGQLGENRISTQAWEADSVTQSALGQLFEIVGKREGIDSSKIAIIHSLELDPE